MDDQQTWTGKQAWWRAKELLDRIEASEALDGIDLDSVQVGVGTLDINSHDLTQATRLAEDRLGLAVRDTRPGSGYIVRDWNGVIDGVDVTVAGYLSVSVEATLKAAGVAS